MAEIVKFYKQDMPAMKMVGKCFCEEDKVNGTFSHKWAECFAENMFEKLIIGGDEPFEDCNAYIGLSRCEEGKPYQYWIGVFMPLDTKVPEGFDSVEMEAGKLAVSWVKGKEPDIYMFCPLSRMADEGCEWVADKNGIKWYIERYACKRFTEPDENGERILDMCLYCEY